MKNKTVKYLKIFLLAFLLLGPASMMADDEEENPGTDFEDGGNVEDEMSTPIDGSIIWLAGCGVGLIFFYSRYTKQPE
jgi:hypothetical protein